MRTSDIQQHRSLRVFSHGYDLLVAADPGLQRLRLAGRTTLSAAVTLGLEVGLAHVTGQSIFRFLIGVVVALFALVAVSDPEPRAQRLTAVLIVLPALAAVTLAALLSFQAYVAEAVFVVIMFGAVYVRRFGPRWFALGMLSFVAYFFSLFLKAHPVQLPWMWLAVVVGVSVSYAVRYWVLPDPPHPPARLVLAALRARLRLLLSALRAGIRAQAPGRHAVRLRKQEAYLSEITLLDLGEEGEESWAEAFFRIELAAQGLARLGTELAAVADREAVVLDIDTLRSELRGQRPRPSDALAWRTDSAHRLGGCLRGLADAVAGARPVARHEPEPAEDEPPEDASPDTRRPAMRPTTRQAFQVALAGALSIVGGELLASPRWYWAALTAFIVFTGTESRGHVFIKGWQRVAGTFLGVGAGILAATLLHGQSTASFALMFASIFLAFYFIRVSDALMIFWLTVVLALLYGLLGFFSVQLLAVRLEETIVGAAAGILAAIVVFPSRTPTLARERSQDFLAALEGLIADCAELLRTPGAQRPLLTRVRDLDRSFHALRQAVRPLILSYPGASRLRPSQHWLRVVIGLRYQAHRLARLAERTGEGAVPPAPECAELAHRVRARIQRVARALATGAVDTRVLQRLHESPEEAPAAGSAEAASAAGQCLMRIDWTITLLASDLGVAEGAGSS